MRYALTAEHRPHMGHGSVFLAPAMQIEVNALRIDCRDRPHMGHGRVFLAPAMQFEVNALRIDCRARPLTCITPAPAGELEISA